MKKKSVRFILFLLISLLVSLGIHLFLRTWLDQPILQHRILLSYLINFLLALVVLVLVEKSFNKQSAQSGFVFMGGSGIKFLFFFLFFYPFYKADGIIETTEFTSFFVPYAICLILEVAFLSKELNNQQF